MADYTKLNMREVENQAPKFGFPPEMEARFATRPLELEQCGVGLEKLAPGFRIPFGHRHSRQEEVYVVVAGSGRIKIEDEIVELNTMDAVRLPPGTMRQMEAGPEGVEYLAFGAPAGAEHEQDAEIVPGWWE